MDRNSWLICFTHMFNETFYLAPFALIPVAMTEFDLGLIDASLMASIPGFVALLMNLPAGFLADKLRVNRLLFSSLILEGLAMLFISQTSTYISLLVFTSLMRVTIPLYHAPGLGRLARITEKTKMSKVAGFHNAIGNVGQALGVLTIGICLLTVGWRAAYLFWAFPTLVWGFLVLYSLNAAEKGANRFEHFERKKPTKLVSLFPGLIMFLIILGLKEAGTTSAMTYMTTYFVNIRNFTQSAASLVLSFGPFIGIAGSLLGGHIGDRFGLNKAFNYIIIACAASLISLSMVDQSHLLILAFVAYSLFSSSIWAPTNAITADVTPSSSKGLGFGLASLTTGTVDSLAPVFTAGIVQLTDNLWTVFPLSASFLLFSFLAFQLFSRTRLLSSN